MKEQGRFILEKNSSEGVSEGSSVLGLSVGLRESDLTLLKGRLRVCLNGETLLREREFPAGRRMEQRMEEAWMGSQTLGWNVLRDPGGSCPTEMSSFVPPPEFW